MVLEPRVRRFGTGRTRASLIKGDTHKALADCAVKPLFGVYCALRIRRHVPQMHLAFSAPMSFALSSLGIFSRFCMICSNVSMVKYIQSAMYNKRIYSRVLVFSLNCSNPPIVLTTGLCYPDRVPLSGKRGYSCAVVGWYR